jgi:hypothetical protein
MDKKQPNPDPTTHRPSPAPRPDTGESTPPHGDEVVWSPGGDDTVNADRNMSRRGTPSAADPDNDRPAD